VKQSPLATLARGGIVPLAAQRANHFAARFARFAPKSPVRGGFAGVMREKFFTCLMSHFSALAPRNPRAIALDARAVVIAGVGANDL
jgi:hypothetical protein